MNSDERGNEPFVELVAGVGGSGEELYGSAQEYMRSREGLGKRLFPAAEGATASMSIEGTQGSTERDRFMAGLMTEVGQVQLQATSKNTSRPQPLFEDGLVPAADGFHWAEPRRARLNRSDFAARPASSSRQA